jgi:LysR family glycine cleavage system transcriptional activator
VSEPNWYNLPSLSALRAFEATARTGSFANAARALNVTQAAVAQQVRGLEAELGVALARRAGRTVALTNAGSRFAARLGDGFSAIASGVDELVAGEAGLPIQASVTTFVAQSVVLPRIHEFWKSNPDIQVSMMPSLEIVDIVAMGFDLAIRATVDAPVWTGLNSEFLCESQLIVVGAPSLIGTELPDISKMPWIFTRGNEFESRRLRSIGLDPNALKNVELGSPSYENSAAIGGLGLSIAPRILVRDDLAADRLREVPVTGLSSLSYYAVTPKGPVRPQATKFIDWLMQIFAE